MSVTHGTNTTQGMHIDMFSHLAKSWAHLLNCGSVQDGLIGDERDFPR